MKISASRDAVPGWASGQAVTSWKQREEKLNDEAFVGGLNSDDRQILRDLSNLSVAAP